MPNKGDVHVLPDGDRWKVEVEGGGGSDTYDTQQEATRAARDISRRNEGELLVHDRAGRIRDRDTHGNDPRNIPG
jgi:hypothetical protein